MQSYQMGSEKGLAEHVLVQTTECRPDMAAQGSNFHVLNRQRFGATSIKKHVLRFQPDSSTRQTQRHPRGLTTNIQRPLHNISQPCSKARHNGGRLTYC